MSDDDPDVASQIVDVDVILSDADFESDIMMSSHCWAVLFVSKHREVDEAITLMDQLGAVLPGLSFARADVDDVKAVCSEFNVRKRMVPRLLVFNSRARQPTVVKLQSESGGPISPNKLTAAVTAVLADNKKDANGKYEKLTLAIGGGDHRHNHIADEL